MIRAIRSKKAQELPSESEYAIYFMIAAALISIGAVFLVVLTSSYQVETTSILGKLESSVLEFRLLDSPECFVYQDQATKRIYPGMINLEKFTDGQASKCISDVSKVCFKAELKAGDRMISSVKSRNYIAPKEIDVNSWPVMIKNKDEEKPGFMAISTSDRCR